MMFYKCYGKINNSKIWKEMVCLDENWKKLSPPGLEPGTLRVWSARDNHYTTETDMKLAVHSQIFRHF